MKRVCRLGRLVARSGVRRTDQGRAIIEFVFLGVLMFVPLVYLIGTLAALQAAAFSATTAAREAGRAFTTAQAPADALPRAMAAADLAFEDYGFARPQAAIEVGCDGDPCLQADARVSVTATIQVTLPLVPAFLADQLPATIPVSATHVSTVDRFGGS